MFFGKKKIGLVLGGGVARSIAHIGVLKIIEKYKIPITCIAGTSSGAIVGAAYAAGMEVRLIEEIALRIKWGEVVKLAFFRPGFITTEPIKDLLNRYIGDIEFSQLKIPMAIIIADIKSGEAITVTEGRITPAVAASSAVPGIFAPEEVNHHVVVDGGLGDNLPVDAVKNMGANFVIAVDVVPSQPVHKLPKDPFQMYGRAFDIVMHKLSREQRAKADILIEPCTDEDIWHLDLHKAKRLIAAGEAAALQALARFRRSFR